MYWQEARSYCQGINSDLASIPNSETHEFLNSLLDTTYTWFGGYKVDQTWKWYINNKPFNFSKWKPGQGNGGDGVKLIVDRDGWFHDVLPTSQKLPFVCQYQFCKYYTILME